MKIEVKVMSEEFYNYKQDYSDLLDQKVMALVGMIKVLNEDICNNPTFQQEDLELVQQKTIELIEQANFWESQGNKERFCYELTKHIKWVLKTFSGDE